MQSGLGTPCAEREQVWLEEDEFEERGDDRPLRDARDNRPSFRPYP
ncbi:hypothetical protein [Alienimonas sp. DA493]